MIHNLNLHRSRYPELCVDIKEHRLKDGRVRITAAAIRAEDEAEYTDIAPYTTKPVSRKRINSAIAEAISIIEARFFESCGGEKLTEEAVNAAFKEVKTAVENGLHLKPSWKAPRTNGNAMLFFERNTLSLLMPLLLSEHVLLDEDIEALREQMVAICSQHGSANMMIARENAMKHLEEAEIILAHMIDHDARIPDVKLISPDYSARAYREEQKKMLPLPVLQRFYRTLYAWVVKEPKKVFFAVLVIFNLRPAEAAGTKPSDIEWHDSFCGARIEHQEIDGKQSARMKNEYSRRRIIIPFWGMKLLQRCCELIGADYPSDDRAMNDAVVCAAWVKQLLIECGATEAQIAEIGSEMSDEDMDDTSVYSLKNPEESTRDKAAKIGCYVLRRCAATIMRVYMGLTLYETDHLLGHIPHGSGKDKASILSHPDLNSPETQRRIAEKMERYVYDPAYSRNPKYAPITTAGRDSIPLPVGYSQVVVENNEKTDLFLEIDLSALEAGDLLALVLPEANCGELASSSVPSSYEGVNRTVFVEMPEIKDGDLS